MTAEFYRRLVLWSSRGELVRFYHTTEWAKVRRKVLARDHNECQRCREQGKFSQGVAVHHIEELKDNLVRALDETNLTTLCNACHNQVHDKLPNQKDSFTNEELW